MSLLSRKVTKSKMNLYLDNNLVHIDGILVGKATNNIIYNTIVLYSFRKRHYLGTSTTLKLYKALKHISP